MSPEQSPNSGWSGENPKILEFTQELINSAKADAIARVSNSPEVTQRIGNAIERRLKPYVLESEIIASQLNTSEYKTFTKDIGNFLGARVGIVACPDGRISPLGLIDPRVASIHRRLQGLPETRSSTRNKEKVLNDPDLAAAIAIDIEEKRINGESPELIEFVGPHIHSSHPQDGCGAAVGKIRAQGLSPELGMAYGGIPEYFEELGNGFFAFDNVAKTVGGKGTTFDMTHDAYSQGFIVGLREQYKKFDQSLTLRENLLSLARDQKILMTEQLTEVFRRDILDSARTKGYTDFLDTRDYNHFAENAMLMGTVAKEITQQEETKEYGWIPDVIKQGKTEAAIRTLAYHSIRNTVYRVLGNIVPGQHTLQRHPEQLIRVGPIGAEFNIQNIPFIENTPQGRFRPEDLDGVQRLYGLSEGVLREQGIDLTKEARIILATGLYDRTVYANKIKASQELTRVSSIVKNNAAWVRQMFEKSIETGATVVIGCLYEPGTKKLTHIV